MECLGYIHRKKLSKDKGMDKRGEEDSENREKKSEVDSENRANGRRIVRSNIMRIVFFLLLMACFVALGAVGALIIHRPACRMADDSLSAADAPLISPAPVLNSRGSSFLCVSWPAPSNASTAALIIGYTVNMKAGGSGDADWSNVGFVASVANLTFNITRLTPNTSYHVMISVLTGKPNITIAPGPTREMATLALKIPVLAEAPTVKEVGKYCFLITWSDRHLNEGPVVGYNIKLRPWADGDWSSVGFVTSQAQPEFTITRLSPDTQYHVMVLIVTGDLHSNQADGPIATTRTQAEIHPVLLFQPSVADVSKSNFVLKWNETFEGDGPILGYVINIRNRDEPEWAKVGYLSHNAPQREYNITGLQSNTSYQTMVSLVSSALSGEDERTGPVADARTLELVFPTLTEPPVITDVRVYGFSVSWNENYIGDGPVVGYSINLRTSDGPSDEWMSVGFVSALFPREFNITGLAATTEYDVTVATVPSSFKTLIDLGPIKRVSTNAVHYPVLRDHPEISEYGTSYLLVRWGDEFDGTGPVLGYTISIRRVETPEWTSVGFVPTDSPLTFNVTNLQASALYVVVVSLLHGHTGGNWESGPTITATTRPYETPQLTTAPVADAIRSSSIDLSWNTAYNGHGPVIGYIVNIRRGSWGDHWTSVGYIIPTSPQSQMTFTVTGLQPETDYDVMITLAHCHSGLGVAQGPVLRDVTTTTDSVEPVRCPDPPQPRPCGSGAAGKHVSLSLVLLSLWLAFTRTRFTHIIS